MNTKSNQINATNSQDGHRLSVIFGMNLEKMEADIDRVMNENIADDQLPGGVVLIWRQNSSNLTSPAFLKAYGNRALIPEKEATTTDTIYDMASLTKPLATASSIMKLIEDGHIRLNDPVDKYISEWKNTPEEESNAKLLDRFERAIDQGKIHPGKGLLTGDDESINLLRDVAEAFPDIAAKKLTNDLNLLPRDRESITIRHLLTHTSGLPPYVRYYEKFPEGHARKKIVADIATLKLRGPVGGQFIYSDLGFITLGEIVERVSGMPLDEYSHKNIFGPLGMKDTMFNPPDSLTARIAPTAWRALDKPADDGTTRAIIRGDVHDGNAFAQDGVSGHAGLFSTAEDVSKYCQMMINGGEFEGVRVYSPATVEFMTTDHARQPEGGVQRGLGWDLVSGYNGQKGDIFDSGFGHTGYTGTSIWVVPEEKLAIIVLTNRVHPNDTGTVTPLRAKIANIVAGSLTRSYKNETRNSK